MNEIHRVLKPGGRFYVVTPAFPHADAFKDPTLFNIITEDTHEYFCGEGAYGRNYGFRGDYIPRRIDWADQKNALTAGRSIRKTLRTVHRRVTRQGGLSQFLWGTAGHQVAVESPARAEHKVLDLFCKKPRQDSSMSRHAEYRDWSIEVSPVIYGGSFRACVTVTGSHPEGEPQGFVFSDLGDCATRETAYNRRIAWAKRWIDENVRRRKPLPMKLQHREWTIESAPERRGHHWHAWVEVERGPWEDEDQGQIFHFTDIGYYDSQVAAQKRGAEWAKAWLDGNF